MRRGHLIADSQGAGFRQRRACLRCAGRLVCAIQDRILDKGFINLYVYPVGFPIVRDGQVLRDHKHLPARNLPGSFRAAGIIAFARNGHGVDALIRSVGLAANLIIRGLELHPAQFYALHADILLQPCIGQLVRAQFHRCSGDGLQGDHRG